MKQKPKIGIMQGRLSKNHENKIQTFPNQSWKEEFKIASNIGFETIEWIFDELQPNPIQSNDGIMEIKQLMEKNDISINSICADYFMTKKLFNESEFELGKNIEELKKLIIQANKLEISMIEIPLVDSSSLRNDQNMKEIKDNLEKITSIAEENNIIINLETDLNPQKFEEFLTKFEHKNIMANYDSGNSASLGYNVEKELIILKKWIKNVHVKDRNLNGGTVQLGTGDTKFEEFFATLSKINYSGDLIIQGARGLETKFEPKHTCQIYQKFVKQYVDKYYI
jgi:L-ribulose-5-phosphate 3-epimerase